ncbi:Transcription factor lbx1 [Homalodisca vitripennis]|nr:Transcription factor lbx1 [Homalodisca vitripennis]
MIDSTSEGCSSDSSVTLGLGCCAKCLLKKVLRKRDYCSLELGGLYADSERLRSVHECHATQAHEYHGTRRAVPYELYNTCTCVSLDSREALTLETDDDSGYSCSPITKSNSPVCDFPEFSPRPEPESQPQNLTVYGANREYYKKRKPRTAFTREQIAELERRFQHDKYLSPVDRQSLADRLGLGTMQVLLWFQNRRAKLKRDMEELKGQNRS